MDSEEFPPTIQNLIDQTTLKWIFVGGKGGVGKTTTSSSIATAMAGHRNKVLIISTDPAHNLGDSFQQSFGAEPSLVNGFDNLYAMEVEAKIDAESLEIPEMFGNGDGQVEGGEANKTFWAEALSGMPGIDEVLVFTKVIGKIEQEGYDLVIFDTAPTGHTLKLLNFPATMEKALGKFLGMRDKLQGVMSQFGGMFGGQNFDQMFDKGFNKMEELKNQSEHFKIILKNPDQCTFVAVCIPEYLSVYETERLVQELTIHEIDIRNVVVNQIVLPCNDCKKCNSRYKMQKKYIDQIHELYFDFHVILSELMDEEIKGVPGLTAYGQRMFKTLTLPPLAK